MTSHDPPNPVDHTRSHRRVHTTRLADDEPLALAIVHAVATTLQRPPLALEPLSVQVDPEALEDLVSGPIGRRENLSVSFQFADCTVVVTPPEIEIYPPQSTVD